MDIQKMDLKVAGPCNFCSVGVYSVDGRRTVYPYKTVYVLRGTGTSLMARVCPDCMNKMRAYKDEGDVGNSSTG